MRILIRARRQLDNRRRSVVVVLHAQQTPLDDRRQVAVVQHHLVESRFPPLQPSVFRNC
ncbi:MAG: hypothetical protein M3436_07630 [Pseudomonadota bacterium]|nr:hypothetical protein [Pseudomonadota bacterium]